MGQAWKPKDRHILVVARFCLKLSNHSFCGKSGLEVSVWPYARIVVGLPDKAVAETREQVRNAIAAISLSRRPSESR